RGDATAGDLKVAGAADQRTRPCIDVRVGGHQPAAAPTRPRHRPDRCAGEVRGANRRDRIAEVVDDRYPPGDVGSDLLRESLREDDRIVDGISGDVESLL